MNARPDEPDAPIAGDCLDSELPDIIDIVREMGRIPEEPSAASPLPAVANPRLPAHLDALADRARDYVEAASSANTRRAYASDWKQFASWCRRHGVEMFPPDPNPLSAGASPELTRNSATDSIEVCSLNCEPVALR